MLSDDVLPQPYRYINKLVQDCIDDAFELIRIKQLNSIAEKRYVPLPGLPRLSQRTEAIDARDLTMFAEDPSPATSVELSPWETVMGFDNGSVALYDTMVKGTAVGRHSGEGADAATQDAAAGKNTIALVASAPSVGLHATATASAITIFASVPSNSLMDGGGGAPPTSAANEGGEANASDPNSRAATSVAGDRRMNNPTDLGLASDSVCVPWCTVTVDGKAPFRSMSLSPDGTFLSVVPCESSSTSSNDTSSSTPEVLVFSLPDTAELRQSTLPFSANGPSPLHTATLHLVATPPSGWSQVDGCKTVPQCAFVCGGGVKPSGSKVNNNKTSTHTLCVAWAGRNCFSTFALCETTSCSKDQLTEILNERVKEANLLAQGAAETSGGAGASNAATSGKGGKGGDKKGGGTGDGASSSALSGWGLQPAPSMPPPQLKTGTRHRPLPQIVCTSALCLNHFNPLSQNYFAVGCFDGLITVWSAKHGHCIHTFNDAPHRFYQASVNPLVVTNISFHKDTHMVAGLSLPMGGATPKATDYSRFVVYDLEKGVKIATFPFVPQVSLAVACNAIPVFLAVAKGTAYAVDLLTGGVIAEVNRRPINQTFTIPETRDLNQLLDYCERVRTKVSSSEDVVSLALHAEPLEKVRDGDQFQDNNTIPVVEPAALDGEGEDGAEEDQLMLPALAVKFKHLDKPTTVVHHVNMTSAVFIAYPAMQRYFNALPTDQLAQVLAQLPDPMDRTKDNILMNLALPSGINNDATSVAGRGATRSTATSRLGGAGAGGTKTPTSKAESRKSRRSPVRTLTQHGGEGYVQSVIELREQTRPLREKRFKEIMEGLVI